MLVGAVYAVAAPRHSVVAVVVVDGEKFVAVAGEYMLVVELVHAVVVVEASVRVVVRVHSSVVGVDYLVAVVVIQQILVFDAAVICQI